MNQIPATVWLVDSEMYVDFLGSVIGLVLILWK